MTRICPSVPGGVCRKLSKYWHDHAWHGRWSANYGTSLVREWQPLIQMHNLSKVYSNGVVALASVTLHIAKGEFVFLVGPSGAGKSTFMKMVIRKELPTEGTVIVGRRNVVHLLKSKEIPYLPPEYRGHLSRTTSYCPTRPSLKTSLSPWRLRRLRHGRSPRRCRPSSNWWAWRTGPVCVRRNCPEGSNNGSLWRGRSSTARCCSWPTSQPVISIRIPPGGSWILLLEINKRGTTVVMATHNREIVNRMRRRVIALDTGRVITGRAEGGIRG